MPSRRDESGLRIAFAGALLARVLRTGLGAALRERFKPLVEERMEK